MPPDWYVGLDPEHIRLCYAGYFMRIAFSVLHYRVFGFAPIDTLPPN